MPMRCVAYGCSNISDRNISLFSWPTDKGLSRLWTKAVRRRRLDFKEPRPSLKARPCVCSAHFKPEDLDPSRERQFSYGLISKLKRRLLLPGSVPSIFPRPDSSRTETGDHSMRPPQKRSRFGAFEKRERQRVINELMDPYGHGTSTSATAVTATDTADLADSSTVASRSFVCQVGIKPHVRSKHTQASFGNSPVETCDIGVQTDETERVSTYVATKSVASQTCNLAVPATLRDDDDSDIEMELPDTSEIAPDWHCSSDSDVET
ncbi:PREDICTED: THAP domain-containing protein 10-like [Priapulus caudatus]|uniref:THAP domain-containing protein 10-like n=1 Tax=Priapulus caudatus TaxID=37621 RepID=A0ABM1E8F9_PRICU|nr:PREDICTED: THAP domain-containing protein 10-like [Priapulus caudatus]